VTAPNDPLEALKWAWEHSDRAWWLIVAIGAGIAWTRKRMRDWSRRNALTAGPSKAGAAGWTPGAPSPAAAQLQPAPVSAAPKPAAAGTQPAPASAYTAASAYSASAYTAQAAYAPPPPAAASHAGSGRKLYRDTPPAQRAAAPAQRGVTPVARSVDVPVATGAWTLAGAFGDPAHARTAIVIAEVLGPPVGLR
jgi:hypothetical protein